jgi:hypothetical protein
MFVIIGTPGERATEYRQRRDVKAAIAGAERPNA